MSLLRLPEAATPLSSAARPATGRRVPSLARSRAAAALSLTYWEFDAAVQLGHVATVPGGGPWQRRVTRAEIDRLRVHPGFPTALRDRVRLVNATTGAELLRVSPARFARLARGGCFTPVSFYVNRHGVVVWRYPAAELLAAARLRPEFLAGPLPERLRQALRRGEDWRPRRWRSHRTALLTRHARGPWERASVPVAVLSPRALREAVPGPAERDLLRQLSPPLTDDEPLWPPPGLRPPSLTAAFTARDPEEVRWYRSVLKLSLRAARRAGPPPCRPSHRPDAGDLDDRPARGG